MKNVVKTEKHVSGQF